MYPFLYTRGTFPSSPSAGSNLSTSPLSISACTKKVFSFLGSCTFNLYLHSGSVASIAELF